MSEVAELSGLAASDLVTSVGEDEFSQLWEDAMEPGSSSGELSDIAKQELQRAAAATSAAFGLTEWAGPRMFDIKIGQQGEQEAGKQSKHAQYSAGLKKLFIRQNKEVTVRLLYTDPGPSSGGLSVSACLMFTAAEHAQQHVATCYQHSHREDGKLREPLGQFVVRMCHEDLPKQYIVYPNGRRVVRIDNLPQRGTSVTIKFTDLSSCVGGINRRDTSLVLCLTDSAGQLVGRRVVAVRVCTVPGRDRRHEEASLERRRLARQGPGPRAEAEAEDRFWVLATSRDNYAALLSVGEVLERSKGGDAVLWREAVSTFNSPATKRRKLSKPETDTDSGVQ